MTIADLARRGQSICGIARVIGRAPSTISRELRRIPNSLGAMSDSSKWNGGGSQPDNLREQGLSTHSMTA